MRDRLEELLQQTKVAPEEEEGSNRFAGADEEDLMADAPQAVVFEAEPVLESFLREAQRVREDLDRLDAEVKQFDRQQKVLVAAMRRFSILKKESSATEQIKLHAEGLHRRLDGLAKQAQHAEAQSGASSAAARIQRSQHAALSRLFHAVMSRYNDALLAKQAKCTEFITRQLEISGREVLEQEVEDMVEQGRWDVFNENVLHEAKMTRAQLSQIEQRHKELVHLEGNMRELRDLFLHIHVLVEEQGRHFDNIQAQVEKTENFVAVTRERFKTAARYKKRNPLVKMCCCCCPSER